MATSPRRRSLLRHPSDWRTVLALLCMIGLFAYQWSRPGLCNFWLYPLSLWLSFTAAVLSHNHEHVATFRSRPLNMLTNYVLGFFYGHPIVAWIPTHNQNHHVYNNREGDLSKSPKLFKGNHLASLLVYPTLTDLAQSREIYRWMKRIRRDNRPLFWSAVSEYVVFFGLMVTFFVLDWRKALLLVLVPQQFAIFAIQCVNFWQHIECDAESDWNHSRNFIGGALNLLLFGNGFHAVHHLKPGAHWASLEGLHAEHEAKIDPSLKISNAPAWIVKTYIFSLFTGGAPAQPPVVSSPQPGSAR
jgi:fatty acid desaturase